MSLSDAAPLFTPEDRKKRVVELKIPLDSIAALYRGVPGEEDCDCVALDCLKPCCARWWEKFFEEFSGEDLATMVDNYLFVNEEEEE